MRVLIVANGVRGPHLDVSTAVDLIIAADGGTEHLRGSQIPPHVVVGDLDSIDPSTLIWARSNGAQIVAHPSNKDASDLELAIDLALEHGATYIDIAAALGGREDHALVNVAVACSSHYSTVELWLRGESSVMTPIHTGMARALPIGEGAVISLLAVGGPAVVTARGVRWELDGETLHPTSSRGLSNVAVRSDPVIEVAAGTVLAVCPQHTS